jgi:hypothetical protein
MVNGFESGGSTEKLRVIAFCEIGGETRPGHFESVKVFSENCHIDDDPYYNIGLYIIFIYIY